VCQPLTRYRSALLLGSETVYLIYGIAYRVHGWGSRGTNITCTRGARPGSLSIMATLGFLVLLATVFAVFTGDGATRFFVTAVT
jgi:hypothetical protein